ncbi:MAG: hypothetical protein OXB89_01595, partial [Anaerolineaceae bacterium]|nr:hypothetical protein [Anaerolineaceae bacterium]
ILFAGGRLYLRIMRWRRRVLPDQDPFGAADALLAGACGIYTGWPAIALALLVGVMCAGAAVVPLLLTRKLTLASTLPFAPFLLAGTLLAMRSPDVSMLATRLFG